MKKKLIFLCVIISLAMLALAADSPYARRIRPVTSFGACSENEVAYDMVLHKLGVCTNSGFVDITTGISDNGIVISMAGGKFQFDKTTSHAFFGTEGGLDTVFAFGAASSYPVHLNLQQRDVSANSVAGIVMTSTIAPTVNKPAAFDYAESINIYTEGTHNVGNIYGSNIGAWHGSSGTAVALYGQYNLSGNFGGAIANGYGTFIEVIGSGFTNVYGLKIANIDGVGTNSYAFWYDSAGVFRIKGDGIMAYYNPSFTKYTAGAVNYERIVQQWNTNVAEYGVEAGGTGTLRKLRLLGASVETNIIQIVPLTVATLPTCNGANEGFRSSVTDANATTFNSIVASGGANHMPVFCNGTNWVIH